MNRLRAQIKTEFVEVVTVRLFLLVSSGYNDEHIDLKRRSGGGSLLVCSVSCRDYESAKAV